MDSALDFLKNVPQSLQWGLASFGALVIGTKFLSLLSLFLQSFIVGGKSVSTFLTINFRSDQQG